MRVDVFPNDIKFYFSSKSLAETHLLVSEGFFSLNEVVKGLIKMILTEKSFDIRRVAGGLKENCEIVGLIFGNLKMGLRCKMKTFFKMFIALLKECR